MRIDFIDRLIKEAVALLKPEEDMILCRDSNVGSQLLKVLKELTDEIFIYKDNTVMCKYQDLLLWRKYTMNLEHDLAIIVFCAVQSIQRGEFIDKFDWKLMIDHDNEKLNSIFEKGMADNHYHLGGALPVFQGVWIELMKNEGYREWVQGLFLDKKLLLSRATWIRQYFNNCWLKKNGITVDDGLAEGLGKNYEERKFLYHIIVMLLQADATKATSKNLLCEYLSIKEWFRENVIQGENNIGENAFFVTNCKRNILLKSYNKIGEIIKFSVAEQIRSNYIKRLEIRIKMQNSPLLLCEYLMWLNDLVNCYDDTEVRYIISFSRKKSVLADLEYRNQSKMAEMQKQMEDLNVFLASYHDMANLVVGIDVCSKEGDYKPEVFSQIMGRKEDKIDKRLKRLYHTGESYSDILSGLRAVDECITFFDLRAGDRLSHAIPVFENVDEWYYEKGFRIAISKEEYLDNIVWMYCNLSSEYQKSIEGEKILLEFKYYFLDLYGNAFENIPILKKQYMEKEKIDFNSVTIYQYFEAWKLRSERPEIIEKVVSNSKIMDDKLIAYYIAYCYFYSTNVRGGGIDKINICITNKMLTFIKIMQETVREKIRNNKIHIEVCPSSNVLLGNVRKGYLHPLINQFIQSRTDSEQQDICVSINTDNQGIFSTSIISEYSLLVNAYENEVVNNEKDKYDSGLIYDWVNKIRKNSLLMCDACFETTIV